MFLMNKEFNDLVSNFYFDCIIGGFKINKKILSLSKEILNEDINEIRKSFFKILYNINSSNKSYNIVK